MSTLHHPPNKPTGHAASFRLATLASVLAARVLSVCLLRNFYSTTTFQPREVHLFLARPLKITLHMQYSRTPHACRQDLDCDPMSQSM